MLQQFVIIKRNADSWVTWAETKQAAIEQFLCAGYTIKDFWRIVRGPAKTIAGDAR